MSSVKLASGKHRRRRLPAMALVGTAAVCALGTLSACTPPNEKDAAQAPGVVSVDAPSIRTVAEKTDGTTVPYSKTDGGVTITVHDILKPGNEILVSAQCGSDTHATLSSSLTGGRTDMTPAADMGELIGTLTAPQQIGPGPEDGYHTVTVACHSGKVGTILLNSAGNGDHFPGK